MVDDFTPFALVADDDALIRMDAVDILENAGFRVFEASGVSEALETLEKFAASIQLLFTDVQMPPGKLNGFHLARQCDEKWPHISILVASGNVRPAEGDMPERAVFISKPFSADVVLTRLQEIIPDGAKPERLKKASKGQE